jgi:alpha-glucosidase
MGNPTEQLYARWMSLGVYTPFYRNHSAWDTKSKEPWSFGPNIEKIVKDMIVQRYRMLPYIYSAFHESTLSGLPVARSLTINYTFDEKVYWWKYQNQYLFGDNLLVAPVSCNQGAAKVYLPEGGWYRLSTGEFYKGRSEVTVEAPLNDLPVFVKASGILPLQSDIQYTDQKPSPALELHVYNGAVPNSFTYYEDDGSTYQFEQNQFYKRRFLFEPGKKLLTITKPEGSFTSKFTTFTLVFHSFDEILTISVNGKDYSLKLKSATTRTVDIPVSNESMVISYH